MKGTQCDGIKKSINASPIVSKTLLVRLDEIFQVIPSGSILYTDILKDIQKASKLIETLISDIKANQVPLYE